MLSCRRSGTSTPLFLLPTTSLGLIILLGGNSFAKRNEHYVKSPFEGMIDGRLPPGSSNKALQHGKLLSVIPLHFLSQRSRMAEQMDRTEPTCPPLESSVDLIMNPTHKHVSTLTTKGKGGGFSRRWRHCSAYDRSPDAIIKKHNTLGQGVPLSR